MDSNLRSLPPMKRFRLQPLNSNPISSPISPSRLPSKKRKLPISPLKPESNPISPSRLPTKKRMLPISPLKPDSNPISPSRLPTKKRMLPISPLKPNLTPKSSPISPFHLPTKKRKHLISEENSPSLTRITPPTPFNLPTKKRIFAFKPETETSPTKPPLSKIDLNIEYIPSPRSETNVDEIPGDDDGIICAICDSTDGDPEDPIVFCDGCDLMVHSNCYGNPLIKSIPEGDWFCDQCENEKKSDECRTCCLCPDSNGAMKRTNDGRWAHIVCAVLVPEVFFEDCIGRDGINCSKVPERRWNGVCYLCKGKSNGCVVECSEPKCSMSFHVSCGLMEDLCIELKERRNCSSHGGIVAAFCRKHTDIWERQQQTGKFKIVARDEQ